MVHGDGYPLQRDDECGGASEKAYDCSRRGMCKAIHCSKMIMLASTDILPGLTCRPNPPQNAIHMPRQSCHTMSNPILQSQSTSRSAQSTSFMIVSGRPCTRSSAASARMPFIIARPSPSAPQSISSRHRSTASTHPTLTSQ